MAPKTQRLRLNNPGTNDPFVVSDLSENWDVLDAHPGVFICTSSTRPTWGSSNNGQLIYETDRQLYWSWRWSGSSGSFVRVAASGLLSQSLQTSTVSNSSTSAPTTIVSTSATPRPGGRRVRIDCGWYAIGTNGVAGAIGLYRGSTVLAGYRSNPGNGGSITFYEVPPTTDATTYSLRLTTSVNGSVSTVVCASTTPAFISVTEV